MGEKLPARVREELKFDLKLELSKRISPAKRRGHHVDLDILAGWLVDRIELSNWIVRRGEPLKAHAVSYDLPVMNSRPAISEK